jgi:hypothetical protein
MGHSRLLSFFGLPTPFDVGRLCRTASISSLNRSSPSTQLGAGVDYLAGPIPSRITRASPVNSSVQGLGAFLRMPGIASLSHTSGNSTSGHGLFFSIWTTLANPSTGFDAARCSAICGLPPRLTVKLISVIHICRRQYGSSVPRVHRHRWRTDQNCNH